MIAQKRRVRVTLDIMCYDDLDVENMDWKELLELEGDEEVHHSIKDLDPYVWCDSSQSGTIPLAVSTVRGYIMFVVEEFSTFSSHP